MSFEHSMQGAADVERRAVAVVGAFGDLRDGVRFGMEYVGFGLAVLVLADILEARGRAVVTVGNDHLVLDDQRPDLAPYAVRIFSPDAGHAQVTHVQLALFFLVVTHNPLSPSVREAYCMSMNTFLTASRYPYPNTLQGIR